MNKYSKLLGTEAWKRASAKIKQRDKSCQCCGSELNPNVHHVFYFPNMHPAEYGDSMLILLCEKCHKREHYFQGLIDSAIKYMRYSGMLSHEIWAKYFTKIESDDFEQFNKDINEINEKQKNKTL